MHECKQENFLGQVKEFMDEMKGYKATLFTLAITILLSVGSAIYSAGVFNQRVKVLEGVYAKFNNIQLIGYVNAEEKK